MMMKKTIHYGLALLLLFSTTFLFASDAKEKEIFDTGDIYAPKNELLNSSPEKNTTPEDASDGFSHIRFEQNLSKRVEELKLQRQEFQGYFDLAYNAYPEIPKGLLESIAFTASRWSHNTYHMTKGVHDERPKAYGIMGLYHDNKYFTDVASQAAKAYGVNVKQVLQDPLTNINATAALIALYIYKMGLDTPSLEKMNPILRMISGIPGSGFSKKNSISNYVQDSYVYDIMLTLNRGVDDNGITITEHKIKWDKVFDINSLVRLKAPVINIDLEKDQIKLPNYKFNATTERLEPIRQQSHVSDIPNVSPDSELEQVNNFLSADYGPALYQQSPYEGSRQGKAVSAVTIHTAQGSYAGTINWFKNNPYSVSAHYVIRSSDGQVTQMVREHRKSHHVGVHNSYTIGIEHEGYVDNPSWYTTSMYSASANLVKHVCGKYSLVDCSSAYDGPGSSNINVLPSSVKVKGHQHFSSQSHTDPGIYWNWASYYERLNGGGGNSRDKILDSFEASEGHFTHSPAYSGSTKGISSASSATRTSSISRFGQYSEQIKLIDNSSSSSNWSVRFLSGGGRPLNNDSLSKAGGRVGFWVYSGGSGLSVAMAVDDSDGTERTVAKSIPTGVWSFVEWKLDNSADWNTWVGGNGVITSNSVTLDSLWFYRAQTSYDVYLYIDDVQYRFGG